MEYQKTSKSEFLKGIIKMDSTSKLIRMFHHHCIASRVLCSFYEFLALTVAFCKSYFADFPVEKN